MSCDFFYVAVALIKLAFWVYALRTMSNATCFGMYRAVLVVGRDMVGSLDGWHERNGVVLLYGNSNTAFEPTICWQRLLCNDASNLA